MVTAGLQVYTNNNFTGGFGGSVSTRPRRFMLITRVSASCARSQGRARSHDAELLIANPPPRTPNLPPTAGSASIAAAAFPPFRLRSRPQPHRSRAGDDLA